MPYFLLSLLPFLFVFQLHPRDAGNWQYRRSIPCKLRFRFRHIRYRFAIRYHIARKLLYRHLCTVGSSGRNNMSHNLRHKSSSQIPLPLCMHGTNGIPSHCICCRSNRQLLLNRHVLHRISCNTPLLLFVNRCHCFLPVLPHCIYGKGQFPRYSLCRYSLLFHLMRHSRHRFHTRYILLCRSTRDNILPPPFHHRVRRHFQPPH